MKAEEKIKILKSSFEDVIWMAARYAHGRHTYSPSMVRDAIVKFKKVFPEWEPKLDHTIQPPRNEEVNGFSFRDDYLDDIFNKNSN